MIGCITNIDAKTKSRPIYAPTFNDPRVLGAPVTRANTRACSKISVGIDAEGVAYCMRPSCRSYFIVRCLNEGYCRDTAGNLYKAQQYRKHLPFRLEHLRIVSTIAV